MKIFAKTTSSLLLAALFTAQTALPVFAQIYDSNIVFNIKSLQKDFKLNLPQVPARRPAKLTITSWAYSINKNNSKVYDLLQILSDQKYMASDNVYTQQSCAANYDGPLKCELSYLTAILPEAYFSQEETNLLVAFLSDKLKHRYSETEPQYSLYYRYSLIAASLVANINTGRDMLSALLNKVREPYGNPAEQVWSARALAEVVYLTPYQQRFITGELENIIFNLGERLKYSEVENNLLGFKVSNQHTAVKSFMYTVSFFAKKKDDSFLKSMITTGNFVERSAYLQNPLPGVAGDGGFLDTPDGNRHNISFNLITALFNTYALRGEYQRMNDFIIKYAKLNSSGTDFQNYFLFAIYGLELASAYNETLSLEGWDEQYQNFAYAIGKAVWKLEPAVSVCVTVQGGAEVCTEWILVMKAFQVLGLAAKGSGKIIVRLLPVKQSLRASLLIAARRSFWRGAGKYVAGQVPYSARRKIKAILLSAFGVAIFKGDTYKPSAAEKEKMQNMLMSEGEVYKKIIGQY